MIESELFLARAAHPKFVKHMRKFDIGEELERIVGYFEGLAEEAGVIIATDGNGQLVADVELFRRAVSNLLANAIRHTHRHGAVFIRTRNTGDTVEIEVRNEGPTVQESELERIFDRFYRADPSRTTNSGSTGLGLAI